MKSCLQRLGDKPRDLCFTSTAEILNGESVWPDVAQNRTGNTAALSLLLVFSISFP